MGKNIFIKLIVSSIFLVILSTSFCMSSSYALGDLFSQGKGFLEAGKDIDKTINTTALGETSDYIYNTLLAIGIMIAIIVAMILGIQFMAASADEKAKVKEAIIPFVVGCIVVFGAFTIWKIVVNIGNKAEDSVQASTETSTEGSTTYTKKDGKLYCDNCEDELGQAEQRRAHCENCGKDIKGI